MLKTINIASFVPLKGVINVGFFCFFFLYEWCNPYQKTVECLRNKFTVIGANTSSLPR